MGDTKPNVSKATSVLIIVILITSFCAGYLVGYNHSSPDKPDDKPKRGDSNITFVKLNYTIFPEIYNSTLWCSAGTYRFKGVNICARGSKHYPINKTGDGLLRPLTTLDCSYPPDSGKTRRTAFHSWHYRDGMYIGKLGSKNYVVSTDFSEVLTSGHHHIYRSGNDVYGVLGSQTEYLFTIQCAP
jgi:hypothetical protein